MSEQQNENHLRPYVGLNIGRRVMFLSASEPTEATHGHLFHAVIGPFQTVEGARFMERYGGGNPHCRCVADAERLAKRYPEKCQPEPAPGNQYWVWEGSTLIAAQRTIEGALNYLTTGRYITRNPQPIAQ